MDIRRFGPGYRRPDPPPLTTRVEAQILHHADGVAVVEIHLRSWGEVREHDAPHPILFIVMKGSGFVSIGGEERAVTQGMAVHCPPGVPHRFWTHGQEMTAIAVEMPATAATPEAPETPADSRPG